MPDEPKFPDARWKDDDVSKIIRDLMDRFTARDDRFLLLDALLFRRKTMETKTGQFIPDPFNKSQTIIKHATGILIDRAQFLASKATENTPNIQVNVKSTGEEPTRQNLLKAREEEDALNGIYWEADQAHQTPMQQQLGFSAVTKGVGWYHIYENAIGWKAPSRAFYTALSDEEIKKLGGVDSITDVFPKQGEEFQYAESLDVWERRKLDAMRENATDGQHLFTFETPHPGTVYYRKDTEGISLGAIIEEVPQWDMKNEFGIIVDEHGNIVIGPDEGAPTAALNASQQTWIRIRLWTRDEVYYYVAKQEGGKPSGAGRIVFWSRHDYGEVPLFPCAANQTDSRKPEEEFIPTLEGAYATVPGYNQILTLLSGAAIFNTTPRYIIERQDGSPVLDPDTNEPLIVETENVAGLDPQTAAVINTGGGKFTQLKIENVDDIIKLFEVYAQSLDQTLPPEAATGASGSDEPAWGTRLKQAAANVKLVPVVRNHPRGLRKGMRMVARILRHRNQRVVIYSKPQRRGKNANVRGEIELNPKNISLDISVRQDDADAQEKIVRMQIGMEMLEANRIGPIEYYEKWVGSDDPYGDFQSALAWQVQRALLDTVMIPRILQRVTAGLQALTPNEAQGQAEGLVAATNPRSDMLPGEPAAAAGIRQPGVEQGATQNQLPTLAGPGADSVQGGLPV